MEIPAQSVSVSATVYFLRFEKHRKIGKPSEGLKIFYIESSKSVDK